MKVGDCLQAFLRETVLDQPPRGLGKEKGPRYENDGQGRLDDVWATPGYLRRHREEEPVANPGGERVSSVQTKVLDGNKETAAVPRSNLALVNRDSHRQNANAETLDTSSDDERCDIRHENLNDRCDEVYHATNANRRATTQYITDVCRRV